MPKNYTLLSLLFAALFFGNCSPSANNETSEGAEETQEKIEIAVIPKGTTHVFWKSVHAGAAKAGKELNVDVVWQGPLKEDDRQTQIQIMQNFVSKGVDAIALAPLDSRALIPAVRQASGRKIPVIIFDSSIDSEDHRSFVATDNYLGGKLCAKRLAETMGGKGKAILLRYAEGSASTMKRENGFVDGLKEYGPNIELISENQHAGATLEKGFQVAQNLINRFGEEVNGIFSDFPNETSTQAMLRALTTAGLAGKIKFVGFDANEVLIQGLSDGHVHGLAVQDPFKMGYESVATALKIIKGESFEKRLDTGVEMVTGENMTQPEIKLLLEPEIEKWLEE